LVAGLASFINLDINYNLMNTVTNNNQTQQEGTSFGSSFDEVVSRTEQQLVSSVHKPGAVDYLRKL